MPLPSFLDYVLSEQRESYDWKSIGNLFNFSLASDKTVSKPSSTRAQEQAAGPPIQHSIEYLNILLRLLVPKAADLSIRVLLESLNLTLFGLILYSTLYKFIYLYYLNICYLNFLLVGTKGKINLIHKVTKWFN